MQQNKSELKENIFQFHHTPKTQEVKWKLHMKGFEKQLQARRMRACAVAK